MLKRLLNIAFFGVLISFPPEASADVNVAVVAPQSGSREMFGRELWEGAQIAVNELNENGGLEGEKVKQAAKKLAALYDDQIDVCVYLGRVQSESGKSIKAAWCLGMRNMATKAIVCDLDNGALHFVNVEDITALARDVFYLKTDLMCFQNEGQLPWRLVRMD